MEDSYSFWDFFPWNSHEHYESEYCEDDTVQDDRFFDSKK